MERLRQDLKDATLSRRISNGANLRCPSKRIEKVQIQYFSMQRYQMIEGSLEVQLPTIWTVEKQRREAESEESGVTRKKIHTGTSRIAVFFQ